LDSARSNGVISESLESELREFMGFRRFYRHAYGFMLDSELLKPLMEKARGVITRLRKELQFEE
jgi:hypothetical protein